MNKNRIFDLARNALAAMSGRRKATVVVVLLLIGAGIADPSFLGDVTGTRDEVAQAPSDFAQIESMLSAFEQDQPLDSGEPDNVASGPGPEPLDSPDYLTLDDASPLTIPPLTSEPHAVRVQGVSHSDNSLTIPTSGQLTYHRTPPGAAAADHNPVTGVAAFPAESVTTESPVHIRLTGTIYPIH